MTKQLSPAELADILESGKYVKGTARLVELYPRGDGRLPHCCLGVYAAECGLLVNFDGGYFGVEDGEEVTTYWDYELGAEVEDRVTTYNETTLGAHAPEWMHATSPGRHINVSSWLMDKNDNSDDWSEIIEFLRGLNTQES